MPLTSNFNSPSSPAGLFDSVLSSSFLFAPERARFPPSTSSVFFSSSSSTISVSPLTSFPFLPPSRSDLRSSSAALAFSPWVLRLLVRADGPVPSDFANIFAALPIACPADLAETFPTGGEFMCSRPRPFLRAFWLSRLLFCPSSASCFMEKT